MTEIDKTVHLNVFIDEAGNTPYYNDKEQQSSLWGGVLTSKNEADFDCKVKQLLKEFKQPEREEIHAYEFFRNQGPFGNLCIEDRKILFLQFLSVGSEFIEYFYISNDLNPYRTPDERQNFELRNLSILGRLLFTFITPVDAFLHFKLNADYVLYFDKTDDFTKWRKIIDELLKPSTDHYYLKGLKERPILLNSKNNRFIQLADAICYITSRHGLLEVKTFKGRNKLLKHELFINQCYQIFSNKMMPFMDFCLHDLSNPELRRLFKDFVERDFSSIPGLLSRKKTDSFDHTENTFWEKKNNEFGQIIQRIEILPQRSSPIKLQAVYQLFEICLMRNKAYYYLPNYCEMKFKMRDYINKAIELHSNNPQTAGIGAIEQAEEILKRKQLIPTQKNHIINGLNEHSKLFFSTIAPIVVELSLFNKRQDDSFKNIDMDLNHKSSQLYQIETPVAIKRITICIREYCESIHSFYEKISIVVESKFIVVQAIPNPIVVDLTFQKHFLEKEIHQIQAGALKIVDKTESFHRFLRGFIFIDSEIAKIIIEREPEYLKTIKLMNAIHYYIKQLKVSKDSIESILP